MVTAPISVLMISADPTLLVQKNKPGDASERHAQYAERVRSLDIIVFGGTDPSAQQVSEKLTVYPTAASGVSHMVRAAAIGRALLSQKKIDLIVTQDPHATGYAGLRLKKRFHVPLIVHFHGDFLKNQNWRKERAGNFVKAMIQLWVTRRADGIRAVSQGIKDKLVAARISGKRIAVIPTPVSEEFQKLSETQKVLLEKLRYKYQGTVLLFCGRLAPAKNLLFMVRVIEQLRKRRSDFCLLVVGDGEERLSLEAEVKKKGLDGFIFLLGAKPHAELAVYYHLADLLLLLSTNESFGKVIIEAGLAGTPTLASATTGAASIIEDGKTGFIVPINDLAAAVDVLQEMIAYKEETKNLGAQAQILYRKLYAPEKTIDSIIALWQKVASHETVNDN